MNYEELLAAKCDGRLNKTRLPIGEYYRTLVDGKYRGLVDIRPQLNGSIKFSEALKAECAQNPTLVNHHQLHFRPAQDAGDIIQLEVETGVVQSFESLLKDNPAVVAQKDFIENIFKGLVDITTYLHERGIRHLCYSPATVFIRKGDNQVMLLSHGSYYLGVDDQQTLYGEDQGYVAPEVLQHGVVDERSDVYSLGRFLQSAFRQTEVPLVYRQVLKRAVLPNPDQRYQHVEDMLKAVQNRQGLLRSTMGLIAAGIVALVCLGLYFDMMPESKPIEFVKPAPRQATDDLIEDGYSPEELGVVSADSLSDEQRQSMKEYQAKAEEIFRKRYEKEADRILSGIYNKEYMSNSEKVFTSQSQSTIEELMKLQLEMGNEAGLNPERSQLLASQIIERITNEKKKALGGTNPNGIQK